MTTSLEGIDMTALAARRPSALSDLAQAVAEPLYRFALRLTRHAADAEDVVQQTFASAFSSIDRFEGGTAGLRSWIFTIAYRAAMDVLRGRNRLVPVSEFAAEPASDPVDHETPAEDLRAAFERLAPQDQSLLTLKFQDGFSNTEIARMLGILPNHVGVLLFRAKHHLREALK